MALGAMSNFSGKVGFLLAAIAFLLVIALGIYFGLSDERDLVSVTIIDETGGVRAEELDLDSDTVSPYSSTNIQPAKLIAAVPSPSRDALALLTKTKDVEQISIEAHGMTTHVVGGVLDLPSWSSDGQSIAFSMLESETSDPSVPESWSVMRRTAAGELLFVGKGFHAFPSQNQQTFALTSGGISLLSYGDVSPRLIVASPAPVTMVTPFAVSPDGMRVAWVSPADKSLQVFENSNGIFVPVLVTSDVRPGSLVFSPDGTRLLIASYTETMTVLSMVKIPSGRVSSVGERPGVVKLHAWRYEK
jgi:WD40 repeat protein